MSIDIHGYNGLYIVDTTAFPRPVQIVRQFISNLETLKACISQIQRFVKPPQNGGESRRINYIPGRITNLMSWLWGLCRYKGLKVCKK